MSQITLRPSSVNHFETAGIRANRSKEFILVFSGEEIYALLELLEHAAEREGPYVEMSQLVIAAETIRGRARDSGF